MRSRIPFPAWLDCTLKKAPSSSSRICGCLETKLDRAFLARGNEASRKRWFMLMMFLLLHWFRLCRILQEERKVLKCENRLRKIVNLKSNL